MNPALSSHPAFQDPRHRSNLPGMDRPSEVQPIMPVNMHAITIPMYWPGDEWRVFKWDSVEYLCAPRSILKVGPKLQHQRDDKGSVMFGLPLEIAPGCDATINATALYRKYGEEGLVILGADDEDEARKRDALENRYRPWRYQEALKNRQKHRDACARAMGRNVPSPVPPDTLAADEKFIRWYESGGSITDVSKRFVCQPDGSRWPTRKAAWAQVRVADASKMSDPSAVFDTMHDMPEPVEEAIGTGPGSEVPTEADRTYATVPTGLAQASPLVALRERVKELKARAFDEEIMFPADLKTSLASSDPDVLQIAIEDASLILDGPGDDTLADRA